MTPRILVQRLLRAAHLDGSPAYRGLRGVGQRWEDLAGRRLEAEGYEIRERNYRARSGEIDFIAEEKGILCFVEVKGRRSARFGSPAEAVTLEKQRRIFRAAQEYVKSRRLRASTCRFDVVAIRESEGRTDVSILRGAFEEPPPRDSRA